MFSGIFSGTRDKTEKDVPENETERPTMQTSQAKPQKITINSVTAKGFTSLL